jgi:hypothetical protein
LDEDDLGLDPLEEGMDPPEHWRQADRFGTTAREQAEGQDIEGRLREEQPDTLPVDPETPLAYRTDDELDDSVDEYTDDVDEVAPPESTHAIPPDAARRGRSAEEAGGSVADEIRTPLPEQEGDPA